MLELLRALCDLPEGPEIYVLGDDRLAGLESHPNAPMRIPLPPIRGALARIIGRASLRLSHLTVTASWLPRAAKAHRLDVVHDLTGLAPFPRRIKTAASVATLHDLVSYRPESTNDFVDDLIQRRWLPWALRRVDCVVTVSETVADEARSIFSLGDTPVVAIYHGVDHVLSLGAATEDNAPDDSAADDSAVADVAAPDEPFLLAVGVTSKRKNVESIVRAAEAGWKAGSLPPLLMVGPPGPVVDGVLATARSLGVEGHVRGVGYLSDASLAAHYAKATALVYPSYDEGFGLPIVEAMSYGTPVITADRGATREVAGDAALLVDPYDAPALADALIRITTEPELRKQLAARGRVRAAEFTWQHSALRLQEMYARLMQ